MSKLQVYKPNSKQSGHAMSLSVNTGESRGFYLEMIKQTGWNEESKKGSFKNGEKVNVKFNETEIAGFIYAIKSGTATKFFHSTETAKTSINFGPYVNKTSGETLGTSLSISRDGVSFLIGLSFAETELILQWFEFAIKELFRADLESFNNKYNQ